MHWKDGLDRICRQYLLRDLYPPHTWFVFDGSFTRLQMDDGSSFVFIMSSVWRAKKRPYLCHLSYISASTTALDSGNELKDFHCDYYPDAMGVDISRQDDKNGVTAFTLSATVFERDVADVALTANFQMSVDADEQTYHHIFAHPNTGQRLKLEVKIGQNTPHSLLGPMWIARFIPVPLKWHIFSTRSRATVIVQDASTEEVLLQKQGLAHQEKNWGIGFPRAWIWCQGFSSPAQRGSLAIAGGEVTSFLAAFMLSYRSATSNRTWDFGPAWTMRIFGYSPFTRLSKCDSTTGEIQLSCTNPVRGWKIVVSGKAAVDSFQVMSAPLPEGHTPMYCHESFKAYYKIKLFEKGWFSNWIEVENAEMDNSALEFGGEWSHWWKDLQSKDKTD